MADYNFLQKFIEDKNPTPSYVFDLDALAVHVNKIKEAACRKSKSLLCYEGQSFSYKTNDEACRSFRSMLSGRISYL